MLPLIVYLGITGGIFAIWITTMLVFRLQDYSIRLTIMFDILLLIIFFISSFLYFRFYFQQQANEKNLKQLLKQGMLFYIGALVSPLIWFISNMFDSEGMTFLSDLAIMGFLSTLLLSLGSLIYLVTLYSTQRNTNEISV